MTIDEKLAQMHAFWLILAEDGQHQVRADIFAGRSDPEILQRMFLTAGCAKYRYNKLNLGDIDGIPRVA